MKSKRNWLIAIIAGVFLFIGGGFLLKNIKNIQASEIALIQYSSHVTEFFISESDQAETIWKFQEII